MNRNQYKWVMLVLLWVLYIAFGMVARSIFPLVTPILKDLFISYSQMGMILGSWQLTYILAALMAGRILDQWGIRKSILVGALIIGLSAGLRFFAAGFISMLLTVALFGAGGPMISIGGPKTIAEWFDAKSRGKAVGIYMTGPWIGGLIALSLTNSMIMPLMGQSWRLTFVFYSGLTFFIAFAWWMFARQTHSAGTTDALSINRVFSHLIKIRTVRILLVMALFSFAVAHGFNSWLPKILEIKGLSAAAAGMAASIPLATGIPAILFMPRFIPAHHRAKSIAACALITIFNLMLVITTSGTLLYTALIMFGFFASPLMPLLLLILMDIPEVAIRFMGSAGGMFFCVAEIGGFAGPLIMGVLVDVTGTFLAGAVFLSIICVAMVCMMFFLQGNSKQEGINEAP